MVRTGAGLGVGLGWSPSTFIIVRLDRGERFVFTGHFLYARRRARSWPVQHRAL